MLPTHPISRSQSLSPQPSSDNSEDQALAQRVRLYLAAQGRSVISRLKVSAENQSITLQGSTPTYFDRQLALACARRVAGVREIIDLISVQEEAIKFRLAPHFDLDTTIQGYSLVN